MQTSVDLNADLGESYGRWRLGDDEALLGVVTSANIACGFHAGDPTTLLRTCAAAAAAGVAIGAQVGYADLRGFGRRFVDVPPQDLVADVLYQLAALDGLARVAGGRVAYVKPHGALYSAVFAHQAQARAVVEAVTAYDAGLAVLGFPESALLREATAAGLAVVPEGFADRAYAADGTLLPRDEPGAVLDDPEAIAQQAVALALAEEVQSLCVHGDSPAAVESAAAVRAALTAAGLGVRSFVAAD
ncbi:MAG: LamB/YcsF family protein [Nocardioidaceae bacterium]